MSAYEAGFARGEREAFDDRRDGLLKAPPLRMLDEYQRGYWDGYCARDMEWAGRRPYAGWRPAQEAA